MVLSEVVNLFLSAIVGGIVGALGGYHASRIGLESRLKDLENKVKLLEPLENILRELGSKQVEAVFRGEKK